MSEATTCNYCNMRAIRARAKREGKRVMTAPGFDTLGGINVYVYPRDLPKKKVLTPSGRKKYFMAWLWELTDHCVC